MAYIPDQMKLSEVQREVLSAVELDAERSVASIARETRLKHSNVQRVLASLISRGVIDGKTAIIDLARLGLIEYAFMASVDVKRAQELDSVVSYLSRQAAVSWIAEVGGAYDLMFNVIARHPKEVIVFLDHLTERFPTFLKRKVSFIRTERLRYWRGYLNRKPRKAPGFHLGTSQEALEIDARDRAILQALGTLKHQSFRELAHAIGLPIASFLRRLRALQERELILGFGYRIDLELLQIEQYRILIGVTRDSESCFRKLREFCLRSGAIKLLTRTLGAYDFDLEVDVFSNRELKVLLYDLKELLTDSAASFETIPIFRHRKFISFPAI